MCPDSYVFMKKKKVSTVWLEKKGMLSIRSCGISLAVEKVK